MRDVLLRSEYQVFKYSPATGTEFHEQEDYEILEYCKTYEEALKYLKDNHSVWDDKGERAIKENYVIDLCMYLFDKAEYYKDKSCDPLIDEKLFDAQVYPTYKVYDENNKITLINKLHFL